MSLVLHKMISLLNEHADPIMDSQTYNDLIHGRSNIGSQSEVQSFEDVPIDVAKAKWEYLQTTDGQTLFRKFQFINFQTLFFFIAESLKLQERVNHHCVMLIDELEVQVKIQTKSLKEVTELDLELSEKLNDIYEDTQYFHSVNSR